jgi:alcohol dehydrogenase class IV
LRRMLVAPLANDPMWFELGAQACAGQARSSVGLVHGIAHVLEGILRAEQPAGDWGHAKLCSIFLWPVMRFNEQASDKWRRLLAQHALEPEQVMAVARNLFDAAAYDSASTALKQHWMAVSRDPCSRTNSALARPSSLEFFVQKAFQ